MPIPAAAPAEPRTLSVRSIPASNSLAFLEAVFSCWRDGRLFSITRDPGALAGFGLEIEGSSLDGKLEGGWGRLDHRPRFSDEPAQIVFSSGTEGRPKAILLSHRNLADVVTRLNQAMGVTDEIREYIGVPVTYSFGLGRARAVAAAGGAFFLPERFDPVQIRDMLAAGEINAVSAVPSLWRQLLSAPGIFGDERQRMRWIEIGSQHMAAADKLALRKLFPEARIIQHYGLTEASRSTFLDISATPEAALDSVGEATGSVSLRITDEGAIAIRGDHVALGRLADGGGLVPLTDGDGWLVTRDRGEIRDGRLYYLGRLDDQINVAGIKLGAEGLEEEIRRLVPLAGEHFAIAPVADPLRGEAVLLAVEAAAAEVATLLEEAARLGLGRRGVQVGQGAGAALKVIRLERLPRTGTDKVQRRLLAGLWEEGAGRIPDPAGAAPPPDLAAAELSPAEARLAAIWARAVGEIGFSPQTSFYDAGGDSLSSVQLGLIMESEGLPRPVIRATLEGRSLRDAAALLDDDRPGARPAAAALPDAARRSWAITMTRGVMALSVILSHWGPGFFGRLNLADHAENVLSLFYRMGTPGFAAIFGIGIGYFMLPDYPEKRGSVLRRLDSALRLILLGIGLLAVIHLLNVLIAGRHLGGLQIAHSFYSVLGYYALMLATARLWLPAVTRLHHPIPWLLAAFPALWLLWQAVPSLLPGQLQSVLEWPRLMLVAAYNIFKMTGIVAAGAAVGLWLSQQPDTRAAARSMAVTGGLGMVLMVATLIQAHGADVFLDRNDPAFISLPGLIFYLSFAVFATGLFLHALLSWQRLPRPVRLPLQILLVTGGLALPIYVFHGLVIPGRDLLVLLGVPGAVALSLTVGLFLTVMAYSGRRLWRMYFG